MDKAGKQTSKAIVKGKIMAIQKIAHAEATPEEPAIVGALEVAFYFVFDSLLNSRSKILQNQKQNNQNKYKSQLRD